MILLVIVMLFFTYYSISFFVRGLLMNENLPNSEVQKVPESYFLYIVYLVCFSINTIFIIAELYVICYLAIMTYQLRGVLFQSDEPET